MADWKGFVHQRKATQLRINNTNYNTSHRWEHENCRAEYVETAEKAGTHKYCEKLKWREVDVW